MRFLTWKHVYILGMAPQYGNSLSFAEPMTFFVDVFFLRGVVKQTQEKSRETNGDRG